MSSQSSHVGAGIGFDEDNADDSKYAAVGVDLDEGPFSQARGTQRRRAKRSNPGEWGGVRC